MGAVFGSLGALCIGSSDIFARRLLNATTALTTAAVVQFMAAVTSLMLIGVVDSEPLPADLVRGALSGLGVAAGLSCYFVGVSRSSSAVVAPTLGTLSAVIPFAYAVITGSGASVFSLGGAALAFTGLGLIASGGEISEVRTGLLWGSLGGMSYGLAVVGMISSSSASGAWPAVGQRTLAWGLLTILALRKHEQVVPPPGLRGAAIVGGALGGAASVLYLLGSHADATAAIVSVSMFPAVSVAVGHFFFHDATSRQQIVGLVVALAGVGAVVAS